eukprot:1119247-Amphidinium_carterae.1
MPDSKAVSAFFEHWARRMPTFPQRYAAYRQALQLLSPFREQWELHAMKETSKTLATNKDRQIERAHTHTERLTERLTERIARLQPTCSWRQAPPDALALVKHHLHSNCPNPWRLVTQDFP